MCLNSKLKKTPPVFFQRASALKAGFAAFPLSSMLQTEAFSLSAYYFISISLHHIFPDLSASLNVLLHSILIPDISMFTNPMTKIGEFGLMVILYQLVYKISSISN